MEDITCICEFSPRLHFRSEHLPPYVDEPALRKARRLAAGLTDEQLLNRRIAEGDYRSHD